MTYYLPNVGDTVPNLDGNDTVFVAAQVFVKFQIAGYGGSNFVDVAGTVAANLFTSITLNGSDSSALVEATGQVRGFGGKAVAFAGLRQTLTNYGLIATIDSAANTDAAVFFDNANQTSSGSTFNNYGVTSSNHTAVKHVNASENLQILNAGEIKADVYSIFSSGIAADYIINEGKISGNMSLGDGIDTVVNSGVIKGDIDLGAGADLYDGSEAGGSVNGTVFGGAGADQLYGGSKTDVLDGGSEADYLDGGRGADMMMGGTGNDVYVVDDKLDLLGELTGDTNDIVYAKVSYTLAAGVEIESLVTINSSQTTAIDLTGNEFAQTIKGNEGKNILKGADGNDVLQGFGGNDTLNGGAGNDTMYGGVGDDTYYVNSVSDVVNETGGTGTDLVISSVTWTLGTDVENLTLTGSSKINGTGNGGANVITGNSAQNILKGAGGADTFVFNTALVSANFDIITDFNENDKFNIDNAVFVGLSTGTLSNAAFKEISSATSTVGVDSNDRILYDKAHGDLYFDRDGSGTLYSRVKFAEVSDNNATVGASDFLVI